MQPFKNASQRIEFKDYWHFPDSSSFFSILEQMSTVGITENVKGDNKKFEIWYNGREEVYIIQVTTILPPPPPSPGLYFLSVELFLVKSSVSCLSLSCILKKQYTLEASLLCWYSNYQFIIVKMVLILGKRGNKVVENYLERWTEKQGQDLRFTVTFPSLRASSALLKAGHSVPFLGKIKSKCRSGQPSD